MYYYYISVKSINQEREIHMKKSTKIMITVLAVVLVLGGIASYLVPMFLLKAATKEIMPECKRAEYITDLKSKPEGFVIMDNGGYTIKIPSYLSKSDYEKANVYSADDGTEYGSQYIFLMEPFDEEMSLVDAYEEDNAEIKKYGIRNVKKMFESLGYGTPDSYYNVLKCTCLLDWEDYNVFSVRKSVAFSVYAALREGLYMTLDNYIYERDDVRAIVQTGEEGYYTIDIFHTDDLNAGYGMRIKDENLSFEEMVSMLNTVEFK